MAEKRELTWTMTEDAVLIDEAANGVGWEERAAARLAHRDVRDCEKRAAMLHLRTTRWLRDGVAAWGKEVPRGAS